MTLKMMPGRVAQIEWNDPGGKVSEVVVFNREAIDEAYMDRSAAKYDSSHGACVLGWMEGSEPRATPEGQFLYMLRGGFVDDQALLSTLDQFGQIEEAGWARTMASALRGYLIQEGGGDDDVRERYAPAVYE